MNTPPITIETQIKCVQREIALRRNVYRKRVLAGHMKASAADRQIEEMTAVLTTLQTVAAQNRNGGFDAEVPQATD